ncbi:MAG: sensory transduction histidine kinase [Deltaproteobacteria bacterium]|nr:sensory transduction histidine kinase [Deltaproteobacteria bacterium]
MQVKQRLQINVTLSVLTACIIIPMLVFAIYRVNKAVEAQKVSSDIIIGAFERVALRNDYVRNNSERARIQWFAKHEQIGRLLKSASQVFGDPEDRVLLSELGKDHGSLFNLFSGIVENREKTSSGAYPPALSQEIENRLISQLNIKVYDTVLLAGRLHEAAGQHLFSALSLAGWSIITAFFIITATVIINSWTMKRMIAERIVRLRDGASIIGQGNLQHRIDIQGDDEFAGLSRSFNTMTGKLRGSYADLEKEIEERKKINEELQRTATLLDETQAIARVGGWELDLVENTLYWTEETYRIHETSPAEYTPTVETAVRFYAPESVPVITSAVKEAIEQGKEYSLELQIITAKGRLIWVETVGKAIRRDKRVVKIMGAFRDISERKKAEALRQSSAYHRSLIEASLDPLVTIDASGKITDVNAATEKVTGRTREKLINTDFSDYFTDPEKARAGYQQVFREGSIKDYPLEIQHKDGYLTPVLYNAAIYRDESGSVVGVFAAARDITERKKAEEIAKLDEARTDSILRISQFSAESLRELLDFALDEAIALSGSKFGYLYFYHEDTQEFVLQAWSKDVMTECTIADPQTDYKLEKTGIWGEVVRQRKAIIVNDFSAPHPLKKGYPEGHAPLVRFFSVPIFSEGRIVAVTGFANRPAEYTDRDVSQMTLLMDSVWKIVERKKAEEKLKLASAYNRSLLEASLDPLVTIDAGGKITDVNIATEKVTGRSRAELIGTDFSDYFMDPAKAKSGYQQVFKEGFVMDYALEIRHRNGHVTPVLYNAAVYNDDAGNVIGVFAAARDITERKKAEEEIQKLNRELEARVIKRTAELENSNKELEAFSYSVSHDLRSPLRSIEGFSLALLEDYGDRLDDTGKSYLDRVRNATIKMGHLIDDLLKLSRVTRSEMNRERVDLTVIGKDIAGRLAQSHLERSAEFVIAEDLTAYGDARLLTVVLENLFSNAWKFSEKATRSVIEFGVTYRENTKIFYVKDNGVGFDMAYVAKLFNPFQRLHNTREFPGTGIGLATVKRVISRHGGQVWIESEVNKGTTVYFTL